MLLALLLLQGSLLVKPMYLSPEVPDGRGVRGIVVAHKDTQGAPSSVTRTSEEARALAEILLARVAAGEDLATVARSASDHASARFSGVIGTVWPGMLSAQMDEFLFNAEVNEISGVIESPAGFHILERLERDVAWRHIRIEGTDEAARRQARELVARLNAGEDFAELAASQSSDPISAARGGVAGIFTRGPRDTMLKAAAFAAPMGKFIGPLDTPNALYILERLDPSTVDPALRETAAIRVRAILISFTAAKGAPRGLGRTSPEAEELALSLADRIRSGEDMAALAAEFDDDAGGRERGGDLGWILRQASDTPAFLERAYSTAVGELVGPVPSNAGWVLFRRER